MTDEQEKEYMVVLWDDYDKAKEDEIGHKIEEFSDLKEAVLFLMKNGAFFEHQEIVRKVNWLPGSEKAVPIITDAPTKPRVLTQEEIDLANRPNPTGVVEQPTVIGDTTSATPALNPVNSKGRLKKHMFEGIIPDAMLGIVRDENDN